MIGPLHIEIVLASAYAAFLIVVAAGLELFGRHSHRRSGQFRTAGFKYHGNLDVWECPRGHHLHPRYRDPVREVVRYRAPAHTCNACVRKTDCTDSEHGREIIHSSESWIETKAGKFYRVLSLTLLFLATLILSAEMFRYPTLPEVLLPGSILALVLMRGQFLVRQLLVRHNRTGSESMSVAFGSRRL
jgi:hypothetical protein